IDAHDGAHGGGLAGSVAAYQTDNLASVDGEGQLVYGNAVAETLVQLRNLKHLSDWYQVDRLANHTVWTTGGNRLRRRRSDVFPIVGVVVSAVLILIGRTQRNNPVAIAGYIVLALSAVLYFYLRSR